MKLYTFLLLFLPVAFAAAETANFATGVATALAKELKSYDDVVTKMQKEFSTKNIADTCPQGGPGADSRWMKYMGDMWRNSVHNGGMWYGNVEDLGYIGYASSASMATTRDAKAVFVPANGGIRRHYPVDGQYNIDPEFMENTGKQYDITQKPFFKKTNNGASAAWWHGVSTSSGSLNYYYVQPMKSGSKLIGCALQGFDASLLSEALAAAAPDSSKAVLYVLDDKNEREMIATSVGQKLTWENPSAASSYDRQGLYNASQANNSIIRGTWESADGASYTGGYTVTRKKMAIGENNNYVLVAVSKLAQGDPTYNDGLNALKNVLQKAVHDMQVMNSDVNAGILPHTSPGNQPGLDSPIQQMMAKYWRAYHKVGLIAAAFPSGGYIGYSSDQSEFANGLATYFFVPPKNFHCEDDIPTADCGQDKDCSALKATTKCRRWYRTTNTGSFVPTVPYRQKEYVANTRGWYKAAFNDNAAWAYSSSTTLGGAALYRHGQITVDGTVKGVLLHASTLDDIAKLLKTAVGKEEGLTLYVVEKDGNLIATGGSEKISEYFNVADKKLRPAVSATDNDIIKETAKAREGKWDKEGTFTVGKFSVDVARVNGFDALGWTVVAVRDGKAKAGAAGFDTATLVLVIITLLGVLFLVGKSLVSTNQRTRQSNKNPMIAMTNQA